MGSTQEQLLRFFDNAAGRDTSASSAAGPMPGVEDLLRDSSSGTPLRPMSSGYTATDMGTSSRGGAASAGPDAAGTGSAIESAVKTLLEGGLGIVPLIGSLIGLFGGEDSAPAQLEKYQRPSAIDFLSADTLGGLTGADYDQFGMPRLSATEPAVPTAAGQPGRSNSAADDFGGGKAGGAAQVTVNIQALDAQSILDRSGEIAQAVRSAMLNMSTINDVISDL